MPPRFHPFLTKLRLQILSTQPSCPGPSRPRWRDLVVSVLEIMPSLELALGPEEKKHLADEELKQGSQLPAE